MRHAGRARSTPPRARDALRSGRFQAAAGMANSPKTAVQKSVRAADARLACLPSRRSMRSMQKGAPTGQNRRAGQKSARRAASASAMSIARAARCAPETARLQGLCTFCRRSSRFFALVHSSSLGVRAKSALNALSMGRFGSNRLESQSFRGQYRKKPAMRAEIRAKGTVFQAATEHAGIGVHSQSGSANPQSASPFLKLPSLALALASASASVLTLVSVASAAAARGRFR